MIWTVRRLVSNIIYWFQSLGFFLTHGFHPVAWYGFYSYWGSTMVRSLKYMRNHTHGHPGDFNSVEEWQTVLDKIIFALEELVTEKSETLIFEKYSARFTGIDFTQDDGRSLNLPPMSEAEIAEHKQLQDKIEEGLDLFRKYFRSLWD